MLLSSHTFVVYIFNFFFFLFILFLSFSFSSLNNTHKSNNLHTTEPDKKREFSSANPKITAAVTNTTNEKLKLKMLLTICTDAKLLVFDYNNNKNIFSWIIQYINIHIYIYFA